MMSRTSRATFAATVVVALTSAAGAQTPPKVRPLGPIVKVSTEPLGSVSSVRQLSDGRVLVNDIIAHRVVLFDTSLTKAIVVADSTSATANAYGVRPGGLIAYRDDSTLFVDPASLSMLVIDPKGRIAHVISAPRPNDIASLIGGPNGTPGFDAQGRLVYSARIGVKAQVAPGGGKMLLPDLPDSSLIVRVDLATRKLDTLGGYGVAKAKVVANQDANGNVTSIQMLQSPLPLADDWAVEPDGSVAIVRGRDYHVDWLDAAGHWTSSPKMPFDWEHLDDDRKVALLDSVKAIAIAHTDSLQAALDHGTTLPSGPPDASGAGGDGGGMAMVGMYRKVEVASADGGGRGSGGPPPSSRQPPRLPPPLFIPANELPDYKPPFQAGSTRADAEGNLWIRTTHITNGRAVYDIVNRKGELIDRVQIPAFRIIAGFGPGVVYMGVRDAEGNVHLERARIR